MKTINKTIFVLFLFLAGKTYGQQFVYTPVNPAFGGNPYNYSWMLSSAQAQNDIKTASSTPSGTSSSTNTLNNFATSLNQQILSALSQQIVAKEFGENALTAGTYTLGTYQINITNQTSGLNISIQDNSSGASTTVTVPYF